MSQAMDQPLERVNRLLLWIDRRIDSSQARSALEAFASEWAEAAAEIRAAVEVGDERDALARQVATMRGEEAPPRVVRMPLDQRTLAVDTLLAALLGLEFDQEGRIALERLLGLRSGHDGGLAGSAGVRLEIDGSLLADGHAMRSAVADATDDQLELVRLMLAWFRDWIGPLLPVLVAGYGAKSAAFERIVEAVLSEPPAELYAAVAVSFLVAQARHAVPVDQVHAAVIELATGASDLQLLRQLPETERKAVFARLPERRRATIAVALRDARLTRNV